MATPRVILRFRELTPDVDTIHAHLAVKKRKGSVWWGWWKKEAEPDHANELRLLGDTVTRDTPIYVWLIDTSAERLHLATVIEVKRELPASEQEKVPRYYRDSIDRIPAWFRISNIEVDQPYRRDLEAQIGQRTLALLPA